MNDTNSEPPKDYLPDRRAARAADMDGPIDDRRVARSDRRDAARHRVFLGGKIWPMGAPADCVVRNLSETGACIEISQRAPDRFEMVFGKDNTRRWCVVIWQTATRAGIRFELDTPESGDRRP
jgi:hypothetical protein